MGGDGGHHGPPKVPDYRIYKVENCPPLMRTQRMLAQHGLKDPWLRNEVWRYPPEVISRFDPDSRFEPIRQILFRKVKLGFGLAILTIIGEKIYHHYYPKEEHHH